MAELFTLPNNHTISYAVYGAKGGYPIIGCHGLAGSVEAKGLDRPLAKAGLRYILIARPGYGKSDFYEMETAFCWADEIAPLLEKLNIEEFDVVGMSAGAVYAYALAAAFPKRVKALCIYSGIGAIYKPEVITLYPQSPELTQAIELYTKSSLADIASALYKAYIEPMPKRMRKIPMIRDSVKGGCMGMAQTARLEFLPWGFEIEEVAQPVRMFHSRSDAEVPYAIAEKTMGYLKDASMRTYEKESHQSPKMLKDVMKEIVSAHARQEAL